MAYEAVAKATIDLYEAFWVDWNNGVYAKPHHGGGALSAALVALDVAYYSATAEQE